MYRYTDGKFDDFRYVVLGYCESSRPDELNITSYDMQMLDKMIEVYEANNISENDKCIFRRICASVPKERSAIPL